MSTPNTQPGVYFNANITTTHLTSPFRLLKGVHIKWELVMPASSLDTLPPGTTYVFTTLLTVGLVVNVGPGLVHGKKRLMDKYI